MSEVLNFDCVFDQNKEVFNVKLEHTNARLTTSYKIKLLIYILYIYIYIGTKWCDFVQFSYYKIAHHTVQCGAIHYHLR